MYFVCFHKENGKKIDIQIKIQIRV